MDTQDITLPPGVVTGIGSLPFRDARMAVEFVAQHCPHIPFWPELPQRTTDERSIEQACVPIADLLRARSRGFGYEILDGCLPTLLERLVQTPVYLDSTRSAGFFAFTDALVAGQFPHAVAIKGQLVGPLTLGWHIFHHDTPLIAYPAGRKALQQYSMRLAQWQIEQLAQTGKPVLLFLDEPCLALVPPDNTSGTTLIAMLQEVVAALQSPNVLVGVHTCATLPHGTPSTALCHVQPDILSFDAHQDIEAFAADPAAKDFLHTGRRVAFGLVPTWSQLDQVDVNALFMRWLVAAPDTLPIEVLAHQTLITATCGLGLLPETAAAESFRLAHQLAEHIAQVAARTVSF